MRIKASALGLATGIVVAIAFGVCGVFFAVAPGPTSALMSWVLHIDITAMARPVSAMNLIAGIALFGTYVGVLVGIVAALYNRIATPRTT
jgi:hypothetical protein